LFLDPKATAREAGAALVSAEANLHDIAIRDLVIEGAESPAVSTDPNSDRRRRARPTAPRRAGIVLTAAPSSRMRGLHFEHVTVRNCTENGVAIRGATNVVVEACDFSDNGSGVLPGVGSQHNLVIAEVQGCEVNNSRFDTSPGGCGLDLDQSRDITLLKNELARNSLYGLRATQSQNLRLQGNLVEGNDHGGALVGALSKGCRDIELRQNLCRNNGGYGLEIVETLHGVLSENKLGDNGRRDQVSVTASEGITRQ
jgi:nitrous oxidase accessory protein NosD